MRYLPGVPRNQSMLLPPTLDDYVSADNDVRAIDMFVDSLDLEKMGFTMKVVDNGRPAYHPGVMLKLYIYGYLNRIRSSRAMVE